MECPAQPVAAHCLSSNLSDGVLQLSRFLMDCFAACNKDAMHPLSSTLPALPQAAGVLAQVCRSGTARFF